MKTQFWAEIKEFKAVKSITNDKMYRFVALTPDDHAAELICFSPDRRYKITVEEMVE